MRPNGRSFQWEGRLECVGRSGKTGSFYSGVVTRESQVSLETGGGRNVLRGSEKGTPGAEAEVTRVWYRRGVCPKR